MDRTTARQIALLCVTACAPIALGIAMHYEHAASHSPAIVIERAVPVPIAIAVHEAVSAPAPTPVPAVTPDRQPEPAAEDPSFAYGRSFAFVEHIAGPHVVLATETEDPWMASAATAMDEQSVRRDARLSALPAGIVDEIGQPFDLYDANGRACSGRIGTPFLYADLDGEPDMWMPEEGDADREERPTPEAEIWLNGRRLLVAPLLDPDASCERAMWARAARLSAPTILEGVSRPTKTNVGAARTEFLALPEVQAAAADFDAFVQDNSEWLADPQTSKLPKLRHRLRSTAYRGRDGNVHAVLLEVDGPEFGGCGGVSTQWGAARVSSDGAIVENVFQSYENMPALVVDLENDGVVEIFTTGYGTRRLLALTEGELVSLTVMDERPYFGCPC